MRLTKVCRSSRGDQVPETRPRRAAAVRAAAAGAYAGLLAWTLPYDRYRELRLQYATTELLERPRERTLQANSQAA
jgi:hypothetical protein